MKLRKLKYLNVYNVLYAKSFTEKCLRGGESGEQQVYVAR